ncbi:MAG: elongation factor 4 [Phycisphaeraceae bacterium]|nr:elongation factor 4 [Phycisphaerae bacterium]MBX3393637.1 elongation factor 4 [Phycisphaeraceae bacterium]HRJ49083.1 GTP-binding protein [Phycisphaerales bacterium]
MPELPPKPSSAPRIRNFSIIAHIDHGKSTLADRLLQATNAVSAREAKEQILDSMDIERERGITIKASAVTVYHRHKPGAGADDLETDFESPAEDASPASHQVRKGDSPESHGDLYMLNFIDTPGHVDFNYEVSRALKACEGAILVVDATQGVQAQTLVNAYLAVNENLTIIPVINKIDLPSARTLEVAEEVEQTLGFAAEDCLLVSAKTGVGIPELLAAICERFPGPREPVTDKLRALIFDAVYDDYRGVIVYVRVFDGRLRVGDKIRMIGTERTFQVTEIGKMTPKPYRLPNGEIGPGETAYVVAAIRSLRDVRIGDTVTLENAPAAEALPGYQPPRQMVFCDFYPATTEDGDGADFEQLRDAVEKLSLNDSSFTFQPVHSEALGFGFRCGFLGLLHMDIVQERLEREGGVQIVQTAPTVSYHVLVRGTDTVTGANGQALKSVDHSSPFYRDVPAGSQLLEVHNPADLPNMGHVIEIREPICKVEIMLPKEYIGDVMKLCLDRRGLYKNQNYVSTSREIITFEVPLAEIIYDFFDKMKGMTSGYGTMDYEVIEYRADNLVKMDTLINGEPVEALALIVHRDKAEFRGRNLLVRLKEQIPRHQFEIPLQSALGGKVIARETIKAYRKDVLAKCYGGDVSRKRKLLEKQKEGKKRMKNVGSVTIPQEAFMAVLDQGD